LLQGAGVFALGTAAFGRTAAAASYPDRPVRIIVPFAAGGPSDMTARQMSVKLGAALGQTFVVENRPGAGSNLGTAAVARSAPDGYTLLVTSSAFVVNPGLYKQVPYDPFKDFAPVAALDTSPNVFIATPASGITSIAELIARAKAKPDELSYASAGLGTTPHLAAELLKIAAGIKMTHVPYPGAGPAMQSILAGTVPVACAALPGAHAHILGGKLRALAVTGPVRWYDLPDVPTMKELGYNIEYYLWVGLFAPKGTPKAIIDRLNAAVDKAMHDPSLIARCKQIGADLPPADQRTPQYLGQLVSSEVDKWTPLLKASTAASK
jgi:tripartite-type tricarboxylate transporter receptor subunit TctC